nr:tRNA lysidine(34) synthetase TilS [Parerythrobacter lutipelagi]
MDTALDPAQVERFRADLERVYSEASSDYFSFGVAVSGGADSLGLLLLAHAACPGLVEAATVDHGLRPESSEEAQFVAGVCRKIGVPHRILPVKVPRGNVQAQARIARYEALANWKDARGLDMIATAHHADDQAETLLMRLNRGSGLPGLVSVRPVNRIPGASGRLVRPLLNWRKAELEEVVRAAGFEPVTDPSNTDRSFDRVRIRQALAQADWIDPVALARSAELLGEADAALSRLVSDTYFERVEQDGAGYRFAVDQTRYVRIEVVRQIFAEMAASPSRSEIARLVDRLERLENASLAGVLATWSGEGSFAENSVPKVWWHFQPEPPRKLN